MYHSVHEVEIGEGELESVRDHYLDAEEEVAGYLTEEEHLLLRKFLQTMPEKHNFVHGDLHMNNVMLESIGTVLFDSFLFPSMQAALPLNTFQKGGWNV